MARSNSLAAQNRRIDAARVAALILVGDYNAKILAERERLVQEILALDPAIDPAKIEAEAEQGNTRLYFLKSVVQQAVALRREFQIVP